MDIKKEDFLSANNSGLCPASQRGRDNDTRIPELTSDSGAVTGP
jgi:hypothetical protein